MCLKTLTLKVSLSEKFRRIGAYTENGQGSSQQHANADDHQVWRMEVDSTNDSGQVILSVHEKQATEVEASPTDTEMEKESLINSQESVITDDGSDKAVVVANNPEDPEYIKPGKDGKNKIPQPDRRSERLKKDVHLTTMEKNEAMAKKRALEGNSSKVNTISDLDNITLDSLAKKHGCGG